jgi:DNA-binding NarL/FixJ family response regulator
LACDPLWAVEYAKHDWHEQDPWLRHALRSEEAVRSAELDVRESEAEFVTAAASLGFASSVVAPAPSCAGSSRVGVLILGSHNPRFFDGKDYRLLRVISKALAMELHGWLLRAIRSELIALSRISAAELELLRHEEAGHTSKMISAQMHVEPKTIDCRFQRLSAKLQAPDRRTAARIARLYGLL